MQETEQLPWVDVDEAWLRGHVTSIFEMVGLSHAAAASVAGSLVDADIRGVRSHGTMRVPLYVDHIQAGTVSRAEKGTVVTDFGAIAVLDAERILGSLSSDQAMALAIDKARKFGVGAVAVRNAFHFGAAARYTSQAAEAGCVGLAASNTQPLMAAIGGAEPVAGNNPLSLAAPSADGIPLLLDMALSEVAYGKIKSAEMNGERIPANWATDSEGTPTTDPTEALRGMLLPAAGPKGLGLSLVIDVLTGLLSSGGWGETIGDLYGNPPQENNVSHFFLALNIDAFADREEFLGQVRFMAERVRQSRKAPGVDALYTPGEIEWRREHERPEPTVTIGRSVEKELLDVEARLRSR